MIWQEDFLPRWTEFAIQYFFPFFPSFKDECGQTPPSTGELSKLAETLQTDFQEKREKLFYFFCNSEHHYPSPLNQERLYVVS